MKLEGKHISFLMPTAWFTRRRLLLVGNRNTLQLLETALVLEGYLMRFFFPLLDRLFRQALSEWTTVTVPYSRILRYKYASWRIARYTAIGILWLPIALVLLSTALGDPSVIFGLLECGLYALLALIITLYCNYRILAPRNYLWFRQADGRRALLIFRIPSRKRQKAFEEQLRTYRKTSRDRNVPQAKETADEGASSAPWILLAVYLVAHNLVVPLVRLSAQRLPLPMTLGDWLCVAGLAGARLLPALLVSLLLVARRNAMLRWLAAGSLLVEGLLPLVEAILGEGRRPMGRFLSKPLRGDEMVCTFLFHFLLALALILLTSPAKKEDRP